jgi:hypothetical protein
LEKTAVEQGNHEMFLRRNALLRDVVRRRAPNRAPAPWLGPDAEAGYCPLDRALWDRPC